MIRPSKRILIGNGQSRESCLANQARLRRQTRPGRRESRSNLAKSAQPASSARRLRRKNQTIDRRRRKLSGELGREIEERRRRHRRAGRLCMTMLIGATCQGRDAPSLRDAHYNAAAAEMLPAYRARRISEPMACRGLPVGRSGALEL